MGLKFDEVAEIARNEVRQVARIFYPDPREALILAKNGSGIEVKQGPAGYQLSSGEVIEV